MSISRSQNPYTQKAYERRIKAARAAGLRVVGLKPDGTIITEDKPVTGTASPLTDQPKLRDAREKLGGY